MRTLIATGTEGTAPLPPEGQARVMLALLSIALLVLAALIILTLVRRWFWTGRDPARRARAASDRPRSAWEESARRAATPSPESMDDTRPMDGRGDDEHDERFEDGDGWR